jgi:N6-adenosine-specific RNA methylase IME4
MKVDDIAALPVKNLIDPKGCNCYLWVTNNFLQAGLRVMESWGFRYVTMITWVKDTMGLGQYFRGMTEHVLFGVAGPVEYRTLPNGKRAQGATLLGRGIIPRPGEHSRKPDELLRVAELVSHPPRIELFSRRSRDGWASWGDGVDKDVECGLFDRRDAHLIVGGEDLTAGFIAGRLPFDPDPDLVVGDDGDVGSVSDGEER